MKDKELQGKEEVLVGSIGDEFDESEVKSRKIKRIVIILIALVVVAAIVVTLVLLLKDSDKDKDDSGSNELKPDIIMTDSDFIKPKSTTKKFQLVELKESKYKFILVQDPKTVNAGIEFRTHFGFNTEVLDGLAHYAEHVWFQGTNRTDELEIFNLVGQFNEFLNAYTWEEETVFQILGSNLTFNETLNIVSNFIQKPMLNETQFTIEVNAVNSEYDTYNYSLETGINILRDNANPAHGFTQTVTGHTGNNVTLRNITSSKMKEILRNYFLTIFKPENCVFLIISSSSFEDMAARAQKYFNFKLEETTKEFQDLINPKIQALDNPIFLDGQLGKIAIYNLERETPLLTFTFEFSEKENYAEIYNLLNYLLFNYNEGSILNYLKIKNYISYYEYGVVGYYKNCEIIQFIFFLTEEGTKNIDKIIEAFFASVNAIKKESDEKLEEIVNNIKLIETKKYQFKEDKKTVFPTDIDDFVHNYYLYGAKNILGSPVYELFTLKRAKQILDELSPDKTFILIDSKTTINSKYLDPSSKLIYTKNYNVPYKMNNISDESIADLKEITVVDGYNFKIREINDDYSKLENMTDIPCYEKEPKTCDKYNETDLNSKEITEPYIINNTENILSLMKIDRTFGIPFVKGYIEFELDDKIKDYMNTEQNKSTAYLIQLSLSQKFYESSLYEAGCSIDFGFAESGTYKIQIYFSTYNDLLDRVIDYINNTFSEPIDEDTFNNLKQQYYGSIAHNIDSPAIDYRNEMINIFKRFITVDTYSFVDVPKELIEGVTYNDFVDMFNNIVVIFKKLKYLTYGDISYELANSTTAKLSSLISTPNLLFKLNTEKVPNVPYNSSIYYIMKSDNKHQVQGRTLVAYEFDASLEKQMTIFSYCASSFLFDYIRTQRGSGYAVKVIIQKISGKSYLLVYVLGKVYSPEKMDRFVNEAFKESFSFKGCRVDLILQHLKNRNNINGYIEDKFENLLYYVDPENNFYSEKIGENEETMTYESIVEDLQEVFVTKVRRFAMLCHRGDETDEEYSKGLAELDKFYYFNKNIINQNTTDIDYLQQFVNDL